MHKNTAKQAKQNKKLQDDLKKMESAAMAAYLKDVENNTRDMTADRIIKEKLNKNEVKSATPNVNAMPSAAPETIPRFRYDNQRNFPVEIDPCDPMAMSRLAHSKNQQSGDNKAQGKNKAGKGKGKKKKTQEDDGPSKVIRKVWYEALTAEGYTYYWNVDTNESVWEAPVEGYMTFAEQQEEAKEQVLQQQLLEQLEREEAVQKADIFEEQRAKVEREKLKEYRKRQAAEVSANENKGTVVKTEVKEEEEEEEEEQKIPYRRDYTIEETSDPYGSWQTIRTIERKPVDLQLPKQKPIQLPTFDTYEPPPPVRSFKEKTITSIATGDSDDEKSSTTTFKKRKIGNRNVRKRLDDD